MPDKAGSTGGETDGVAADVATARRIRTGELFGAAREIVLEHQDQLYRLRITSNGKLILTK